MTKPGPLIIILLGLSLTLARNDTEQDSPADQDELMSLRWQLIYEDRRKQCEQYEQQLELEQAGISTRIARGELAEENMLPHQAALLLQLLQPGEQLQCGGALISVEFVVTAAHCLIEARSVRIYLGSNRYADKAAQVFEVQRQDFTIYPGYPGFGGYHDLALIRLPRPAKLGSNVQPIRLAEDFMQQTLLERQVVSTSGWGALGDNQTDVELEDLLHFVDVPVVEQQLCICYFLPGLVSAQRHICTDGAGGRGACQGDSGGPLIYSWHNVSYLIGLTAFGTNAGCELGAPTVYTRISSYRSWIEGELGGRKIGQSTVN